MFTTLGLFKGIRCPEGNECALVACMFHHDNQTNNAPPLPAQTNAPSSIEDEHVSKKLKVEGKQTPSSSSNVTTSLQRQPQSTRADIAKLSSVSRKVSPPPTARANPESAAKEAITKNASTSSQTANQLPPRKASKESLNPRMLAKAPATHAVRTAILTKLHSSMTTLNGKLAKEKNSSNKCFVLTKDELITMALDEEEKVAKESAAVYSNVIKLRIVKLTKMGNAEWAKEVMEHLNSRYYNIDTIQPNTPKEPNPIKTGLSSEEEKAIIAALITPIAGLEEFGYVTKPPTESEVAAAEKGVLESKGWEKCDRCGGRFQVFPGRREDGALAGGGLCTYHPGRPVHPTRKRTDAVTGSSDAYFACCGQSMGTSPGCTKVKHHVFKVSEVKRLASVLQFETTPTQPDKGKLDPVCFDCEMGYTTLGLELIRLTAISWPDNKELLDILVKPMGEVLDLNSRYSGVFPAHYASAIPYGTATNQHEISDQTKDGEIKKPLQVVESPAAARALLFGFLQPETPLIGHAIENDLNVCRIVHPTIIDTALLYPHPRGRLPNRMSLKSLAHDYLKRDIQMGGDKGHDSKEDSIATGDLVRVKAGGIWKRLMSKGWSLENNVVVAPPGRQAENIRQAARELGLGSLPRRHKH